MTENQIKMHTFATKKEYNNYGTSINDCENGLTT